jgi:ribosome-associated protein
MVAKQPKMGVLELKDMVIEALEEVKAQEIVVLDMRERSSFTDYMVIASGGSERQVKALAENVVYRAKQHGEQPVGTEGMTGGEWALVDLVDVVVHVMLPRTRDFYNLEKLWSPDGDRSEDEPAVQATEA